NSPELAVPFLKKSREGDFLASAVSASGETHAVRLVSWLQGTPLAEVERTFELMRSLGQSFGDVDRALQGFMHAGAVRDLDWDLRHAARSRSRLHFVKDTGKRAILQRFIDTFEKTVQPKLARLRTQVIHNDGNDWNILVDSGNHQKVSGIIDFGDAVHTILIAEVAITCAYS
ncbi:phosphotransferase, partial [Pseudomonas umsongensis]